MDEFGVLTERFGLKPQGKSAPMAASKLPNHTNSSSLSSQSFPNSSKSDYNSNSFGGSFSDDFFGGQKAQSFVDDGFDIFGGFPSNLGQTSKTRNGSSDFGSVFSNSNFSSAKSSFDGDILGGLTSSNSSSADDIFGSYASQANHTAPIDDLFGNFSSKPVVSRHNGSSVGFDDLIPGFGSSNKGDVTGIKQSVFTSIGDPFVVLESTSTSEKSTFTDPLDTFSQFSNSGSRKPAGASNVLSALRPPPRPGQVLKSEKVRSSNESSIDELEEFAMGKVPHNTGSKYKEAEDASRKNIKSNSADDLESFFSMGSRSSSVPKSRATPSDPLFDTKTNNRRDSVVPQKNSTVASSGMRKAASTTTMPDDLFSMFGDISSLGEFEEVEGESEERRKARLDRHHRTKDRVAQAVAEMNQRDLKSQHEQEERRRIAETMDAHIKRWAAGKEGNIRALLSSLQYVLWPESGWEPVSLTDLITSTSVKKVYRKATLCVHPDKVQQKGSTLEQKYTAEKVFDVLKEAWTKFNKEELS
ncbi:Chaperone DnaJ-domain superfamily protein [Euphorbia peplus]|nr:Chaperone DnaJ-domain superfamily protein [Euphorbia peplus]